MNFNAQARPPPPPDSISIDAKVSEDQGTASGPVTSPAFSTAGASDLLVAFIATDYLGGANTTVTSVSGAGLTWTRVARTNTQSGTAEIWCAKAAAALSNVKLTASLSQSVVSVDDGDRVRGQAARARPAAAERNRGRFR